MESTEPWAQREGDAPHPGPPSTYPQFQAIAGPRGSEPLPRLSHTHVETVVAGRRLEQLGAGAGEG